MSVLQAVVLGLVQGLGEFLPISSSAHLILTPWIFRWQDPGLIFDVALHLGTLVAVLSFFWRDWLILARDGLSMRRTQEGKLFWYLVVATIPGAAAGMLFENIIETVLRNPLLIGIMLIVMGFILYLADKLSPGYKDMHRIGWRESLWIGLSQALALIPGVSRSGITMSAGRMLGLNRETSARFSFLLSTPIIFGAGIVKLHKLNPSDLNTAFLAGVLVSAVVGFLAIKYLLRFLVNHSFNIFVIYRFVLGGFVIALALIRG